MNWDELKFWQSREWQVIQEKLDDAKKSGLTICPKREDLFNALDLTPLNSVRAVIVGQDPYPNPYFATGVAFSIPEEAVGFPPTLKIIFEEYANDLHYPAPTCGSLETWCKQGVLLWNAVPTCEAWKSASHFNWNEWSYLTQEILETLSCGHLVFCFLGSRAAQYAKFVNPDDNKIICVSHPSPRGNLTARNPFSGSRIFSSINGHLRDQGMPTIDWRLP